MDDTKDMPTLLTRDGRGRPVAWTWDGTAREVSSRTLCNAKPNTEDFVSRHITIMRMAR